MEARPLIFLSYARSDSDRVESLYERLLAAGFGAWMDKKNIPPEERPKASIQEAIRSSDFFFVCLSNYAVSEDGGLAEEIQKTLDFMWQRVDSHSYLVPVRLEECPVPVNLIAFEKVDLFREGGWDKLLDVIEHVSASRSGIIDHDLDVDLSIFAPRRQEKIDLTSFEGPDDPTSPRDWGIDLRRLLNGERDHALLIHGGAVEYVEVMLEEAADEAAAKEAFHEALEKLVQTWQPAGLDSDYYVTLLLDLIGAYTPQVGFNKVVDFVQTQRRLSQPETPDEVHGAGDDLYLKALVVLENYYKVPPLPPDDAARAYQAYIHLLQEDFARPEYCGYALKRMIQLRVIQLDSPEIDELIKRNPQSLRELLNLLLDPNRRSTAEDDLGRVYTICLDAGIQVERLFEEAVMVSGGRFERREDGPVIILDDAVILLNLSQEGQDKYFALLLEREEPSGRMKFETIAS
jgi:hypothetical protein